MYIHLFTLVFTYVICIFSSTVRNINRNVNVSESLNVNQRTVAFLPA